MDEYMLMMMIIVSLENLNKYAEFDTDLSVNSLVQ